MLDSYTTSICMEPWGRSSFTRAMIDLRTDVELKDTLIVTMPKIYSDGYVFHSIRVEYELKPSNMVTTTNPFDVLSSLDVENDATVTPTSGLPQFDGMWRETLLTTRSVLVVKFQLKVLREGNVFRPMLCLPPKGDDEAAPKAGLEVAPKAGVELPKAGDNNFWLSYTETTLKCVELTEIL
ncbi:hypothetical protein Tco_0564625 [Tanacetum coccineum]